MPRCDICHTEVSSDAKFCPKCGSPILSTIVCPKCGYSDIPAEAQFCPKCGCALKEEPKKGTEEPLRECGTKSHINGHDVVDLGLSVKWALYSVGATDVRQNGMTFAWGDPTRKTITSAWSRNWFMAPFRESICGDPKTDMATYSWGNRWRLPKAEECYELLNQCDWYQVQFHGQTMVKIVGPNDNYMLVPPDFKIWIGNHSSSSSVCYFDINLEINRFGVESMIYNVETLMEVRPVIE